MCERNSEDLVTRALELLGLQTNGLDFTLTTSADSIVWDGDWIYLVITPQTTGVRAYEYAEVMESVETALREEGFGKVLCVPSIPD